MIKIIMTCDALDCCRSVEIYGDTEGDVIHAGWHVHDLSEGHYCPQCWPEVKKELDSEE